MKVQLPYCMKESLMAETDVVEPLFTLELGNNGGTLAPIDINELLAWTNKEIQSWNWLRSVSGAGNLSAVQQPMSLLLQANDYAIQAQQLGTANQSTTRDRLSGVQSNLRGAYLNTQFPHSTSTLGIRLRSMQEVSKAAAYGYLFALLGNQQRFEPNEVDSWGGFIEGLLEKRSLEGIPGSAFQAANEQFAQLNGKAEKLLAECTAAYRELEKKYASLVQSVEGRSTEQDTVFAERLAGYDNQLEADTNEHKSKMSAIETTFKEQMRLRGPVSYWETRKKNHRALAIGFGITSFLSIVALGIATVLEAKDLFGDLTAGQQPNTWKLFALIIPAVFGAWAIRLLVRIFLSNSHLATDAAERVVMIQTYLALLEESKLSEEKDRTLVLASVFRPATDGMIKEESIPHPALDTLTKLTGKPS